MHALQRDAGLHRRLVGYARRFVSDHGEAEDVAQDTWMRAVRHAPPTGRPEAWLFRVCRHAAIDHVRARRVRRPVWRSVTEGGALDGPAPERADSAPDAPEGLAAVLAELESRAGTAGLNAAQRLLLALHYERTLPQASLCRMSGLEPSALRVRLFRARRALAASLA